MQKDLECFMEIDLFLKCKIMSYNLIEKNRPPRVIYNVECIVCIFGVGDAA